jgi:hypothetical protein
MDLALRLLCRCAHRHSRSGSAHDRHKGGEKHSCHQRDLLPHAKRSRRRILHDASDTCFQVPSCHTRNVNERRCNAEAARFQNAFGINGGTPTSRQHALVARTLALVDKPRADPPDGRVKPEHCADDNLQRGEHVVAPRDVTHLVGDDRFDVCAGQAGSQMLRPYQYGLPDADHTGFDRLTRRHDHRGCCDTVCALETPERVMHDAIVDERGQPGMSGETLPLPRGPDQKEE